MGRKGPRGAGLRRRRPEEAPGGRGVFGQAGFPAAVCSNFRGGEHQLPRRAKISGRGRAPRRAAIQT